MHRPNQLVTAPDLLKAEMPTVRMIEARLSTYGYIKGTPEWSQAFDRELAFHRKFGEFIVV